jgi:plasmid maintenance system antidote protein VapI
MTETTSDAQFPQPDCSTVLTQTCVYGANGAEFWLALQANWDLKRLCREKAAESGARSRPFKRHDRTWP